MATIAKLDHKREQQKIETLPIFFANKKNSDHGCMTTCCIWIATLTKSQSHATYSKKDTKAPKILSYMNKMTNLQF